MERSGDLCRVQRMQLQRNKNSGEQGTRFPEQGAVIQHVVWKLQGSIELERGRSRKQKSREDGM